MEPKEQLSTSLSEPQTAKSAPSGVPTDNKKLICLGICLAIGLLAWFLPASAFGLKGDPTVLEQRVIAIFLFAAAMWITEPIPIWTTSVLTMVLMLLTVSNSAIAFMAPEKGAELYNGQIYGEPISYKAIMAAFADPTIMLFMGGFVLAIAATKYKMDAGLAKAMLKPFGTRAEYVLLGFILISATFSMFMSNTATAAMMLTILSPVLATLPSDGKGRIGLALAIPIACNVGGIGTPIGTPPNAIATGFLEKQGIEIAFGDWMLMMVPVVLIILVFSWFLLVKLFPFSQRDIVIEVPGDFDKSPKAFIVYVTFGVTIFLWVFGKDLFGINANVVALIPFAVFSITGVITKKDLALIDWDVLWLVAGGFALGIGLDKTGLGKHMVDSIPLDQWPTLVMMIGAGVLCITMSTFMSNSGTAALLVPILAAAGMGMQEQLASFGGVPALLIGVALSASLAMSLPISTPPNALAYAKGFIQQKDMAVVGIIVGVFGMIVGYSALILFGNTVFGN
ncbi:MAG: SLC13/DASS family transporter [Paludibacteraceae bacterium]|nr:SLC13/DASS family transporter [Paludibacteraceae bacterium]